MFVPLENSAWPQAGSVRDLRVSLNAPVLLGPGDGGEATRAALGWLPQAGAGAVVRLWLRAEAAPDVVRAFDLPERPAGPAARAAALESAERFLGGLGFLFSEAPESADAPESAEAPESSPGPRTSAPGPDAEPDAAAPVATRVATAIRADVRLTKFRRRGPERADQAAGGTER